MKLTQEDTETHPPDRLHQITANATYEDAINKTFLSAGYMPEFFTVYQAMWACRGAVYQANAREHTQ